MATRFNEGEMSFSSCKNLVLIEGSKRSKSSNIAAGTSMALRKTRSDQIAGHGRRPTNVEPNVAAIRPATLLKYRAKCRKARLPILVIFRKTHQHADPPYPVALLRPRRERPWNCRAAEHRDKLAPSPSLDHLVSKGEDFVWHLSSYDNGTPKSLDKA